MQGMKKGAKTAACMMAALALAAAMTACAGKQDARLGKRYEEMQDWEKAVAHYARAAADEPTNLQYRNNLMRARIKAAQQHIDRGKKLHEAGLLAQAAEEYRLAASYDPTNQFAVDELARMDALLAEAAEASQLGVGLEEMKAIASKAVPTPRLNPEADIPIKLKITEQGIKEVYTILCKAAGVNVIFDESIPEKKISVDLQDVTFKQALEVLNVQTRCFYKIMDAYSILVAPDNNQKRQEYDDQVIRTFYLSNAAVKDVFALLRGLIDARNIAQNEALNAITIRDTPERIAVAERIISANDKAQGEVLINVELIEINNSRLREIGPQLTSNSLTQKLDIIDGAPAISSKDSVRLHEMDLLKKEYNWILGPMPALSYQFLKTTSEARVLAQPQLRVTEGQKARVHIGDQVPIPGTQFLGIGTGGGQTVRNFTYQNVGIQIEVQPRVHHNKEITLTINVEVSSIAAPGSGDMPPTIGTRNISTIIRLKDGQVNLLAGLLRKEDRDSLSGVPGLGDTPLLKRLFGASRREKRETDIVLSLTPNIIRMPNITPADLKPLWVGYGDRIRLLEVPPASQLVGKSTEDPRVTKPGAAKAEEKPSRREPPPPVEAPMEPAPEGGAVPEGEAPSQGEEVYFEEEVLPPSPVSVRITPQTFVSAVGEAIEMGVFVSGASDLQSVQMELTWNKDVVEVTQIEHTAFLSQMNAQVNFEKDVDAMGGRATVVLRRTGAAKGAQGTGRLLTIRIKGAAAGSSQIFMNAFTAQNSRGQVIPADLAHAKVQVVP